MITKTITFMLILFAMNIAYAQKESNIMMIASDTFIGSHIVFYALEEEPNFRYKTLGVLGPEEFELIKDVTKHIDGPHYVEVRLIGGSRPGRHTYCSTRSYLFEELTIIALDQDLSGFKPGNCEF